MFKILALFSSLFFALNAQAATAGAVRVNTDTTGTNTLGTNTVIVSGTNAAFKGGVTLHVLTATGAVSAASVAVTGAATAATVSATGAIVGASAAVDDDAYDATAWNGSTNVPTKNALRDKIETLATASNWAASGDTNSSLPGTSYQNSVVSSNGFTSAGSGVGTIYLADSDGSAGHRHTANATITTEINDIGPAAPYTGLTKKTISSVTNMTESAAVSGTDYFPPIASPSAGDILQYDGTNWVRLPKGTSGYVLTAGSATNSWQAATGGGGGATNAVSTVSSNGVNIATSATNLNFIGFAVMTNASGNVTIGAVGDGVSSTVVFEEFLGDEAGGWSLGWLATDNGGAVDVPSNIAVAGRPGLVRLVGDVSGDTPTLRLNDVAMTLGGGPILASFFFKTSALSDGTDTYTLRIGMHDAFNATDPTDGVYVTYTHSANSGKFIGVTRAASSQTTTNLSTTVSANSGYRIDLVANSNASLVEFYVNGTKEGDLSATIPTAPLSAAGFQLLKTAGSANALILVDAYRFEQLFATPR